MTRQSDIIILLVITIGILSSAFYAISWLFVYVPAILGCLCLIAFPSSNKNTIALLTACFVAYNLITILPLPQKIEKIVDGKYEIQNTEVRNIIAEAKKLGLTDNVSARLTLSRNKPGTMRMLLLVVAGISMGGLATRLSIKGSIKCLRVVTIIGVIIALVGYIGQWIFPQERTILWFIPVEHGKPVACFINRNHFGGFIALLAPICAMFASNAIQFKLTMQSLLWGTGFVVMTLATVMSLSRGALFAYLGGIMLILIISLIKRRWLAGLLMSLFVAIAITAGLCLKEPSAIERLESFTTPANDSSMKMRFDTWRDSLKILKDYAIIGTGANAFSMVFPQYRTSATRKSFKHAENEYIEWLVEYGIIGTFILLAIIIGFFIMTWRRKALDTMNKMPKYAVAGALVSAGIHAGVDFALRVPVYFITLCILAGVSVSNDISNKNCSINKLFSETPSKTQRHLPILPVLGSLLTIIISLVYNYNSEYEKSKFLTEANPAQLCQALVSCPVSWQAWYHLGRRALEWQNEEAIKFGEKCIAKATEYDPLNYRVWTELAKIRLGHGDIAGAKYAYSRAKELRKWIKIEELE